MRTEYLVLAASAAALSVLVTPAVRAIAVRVGAVDKPGPRRVHARPVPRLDPNAFLSSGPIALALADAPGRYLSIAPPA